MSQDEPSIITALGAEGPEPIPGGAFTARMDLGGLGPVPVVVSVCRSPVGEDEVAIAVGLAASVPHAAVVIVAASGRAPGLEGVLARFAAAATVSPVVVVDAP